MRQEHLVAGILAHVDAGKTTLSEAILYETGRIRTLGRVDHGDAFLDTDAQERARGITIFSKQAELKLPSGRALTLLDTPGHTDFSAEMERTLSVLDYAILVISAADGVQGHVETLWKLLSRYQVPVFLFINKMDQPGTDRGKLLSLLEKKLSAGCIDFTALADPEETPSDTFFESAALQDESLLETYLAEGRLSDDALAAAVRARRIFPCCFGSALKNEGVGAFLRVIDRFVRGKDCPEAFGARVYKITRDAAGKRLTHMKITGGILQARQQIWIPARGAGETDGAYEKADQLRVYSGSSFTPQRKVEPGEIVAVTGLLGTAAGQGLGTEEDAELPLLIPLFTYAVRLPFDTDTHQAYLKFKELEEEIPELSVAVPKDGGDIHVRLMGEVQTEVLANLIRDRYHMEVSFSEGEIFYMESLLTAAEGVGHYEPLRHYAEVHLLLAPGERGSGIHVESRCSADVLDRNYQHLVLTHLLEKQYRGVLTGAPLTDVRISLLSGRAHIKHTEGGDFRQATYRAVRNGLMRAESVLLEPYYSYRLSVPQSAAGRAMADIQRMSGTVSQPEQDGDKVVLSGRAPVAAMRGYQAEVTAYTRGFGHLACSFDGYDVCHNADEVIAARGYDPEADIEDPAGSVFCAHGAGFYVPWDEVPSYMHLPFAWQGKKDAPEQAKGNAGEAEDSIVQHTAGGAPGLAAAGKDRTAQTGSRQSGQEHARNQGYELDKELEEIFLRTFGAPKNEALRRSGNAVKEDLFRKPSAYRKKNETERAPDARRPFVSVPDPKQSYLLVDGYNIIFAWEELSALARLNLDSARQALIDILSNYQGYRGMTLIVVFDAYRVRGNQGEVQKYHNIYVVYTKEAETADQYIEKTVHDMQKQHRVTVATSDGLEQIIVFGEGAVRMSARELYLEIEAAGTDMRERFLKKEQWLENKILPGHTENDGAGEQNKD